MVLYVKQGSQHQNHERGEVVDKAENDEENNDRENDVDSAAVVLSQPVQHQNGFWLVDQSLIMLVPISPAKITATTTNN